MGVGTILSARKIIIIALGEHKAPIVHRALEEPQSEEVTASFLQTHRNVTFAVDQASASELTAIRTPWLVGPVRWNAAMEKRAVIWLSRKVKKPLLKLEARDFVSNRLHDLLRECGPTEVIRQRVFEDLLTGICTRPGGADRQRIIVFSPHPDDDVISMGGTLATLAEQAHDVHIAYMTSGNIAVFDHDALRHIDYVNEFHKLFELHSESARALCCRLRNAIVTKQAADFDTDEVLNVKTLIRKTEATAAAKTVGVPEEKLHFLELPFYRTGKVSKRPIADEDVAIIANLLREIAPGQIYVAGDLSDPHGTHRVCAQAVLRALELVKADGLQPEVWLYRGAWQEYEPHEIERAVPLSPEVMLRKKLAIFKHESQKDKALFPGHDEREFWVRAEERTRNTAQIYNDLGLPEYYALEGFARLSGQF
jgi:glucosamine-6-phosphate deaminase